MKFIPNQRFSFNTPLANNEVTEILNNSIGIQDPVTKVKFISGFSTNKDFKIKAYVPTWNEEGNYSLILEGQIFKNEKGCKIEIRIRINIFHGVILSLSFLVFTILSLVSLTRALLTKNLTPGLFSFPVLVFIYFFVISDYTSRANIIKEDILRILKGVI